MAKFIDYNKVIDQAMRGIVRRCLKFVEKSGGKLPGNHHFYITFSLEHQGVQISDRLAKMHKGQMTIVMQHQFWDLDVRDTDFTVSLSFNGNREKLIIPYDALISFADPHARFGLQFHDEEDLVMPDEEDEIDDDLLDSLMEMNDEVPQTKPTPQNGDQPQTSKVISIDSFRNK